MGLHLAMKKMRAERWAFLASSNIRMKTVKGSEFDRGYEAIKP